MKNENLSQLVITTHEQFLIGIMEIYDSECYINDPEFVILRRLRTISRHMTKSRLHVCTYI